MSQSADGSMVRVRAGIGYALTEAMDEGHCGLPEEELDRSRPNSWRFPVS